MKTMMISALAAISCLAAAPAMAGDVTVTLTGVEAQGGQLLAALQTQAQFLQHAGAYGERIENPAAGTVTITFHGVTPGDYSFSALHDVDNNGQMTMNGYMPGEGWGMVNGETLRAAPTWDHVKFTVPADGDVNLTVRMIYPR